MRPCKIIFAEMSSAILANFAVEFAAANQFGFFVFNTNLTFLYNIDIKGFEKFQQKIKLPPVGFELPTAAITGLEF